MRQGFADRPARLDSRASCACEQLPRQAVIAANDTCLLHRPCCSRPCHLLSVCYVLHPAPRSPIPFQGELVYFSTREGVLASPDHFDQVFNNIITVRQAELAFTLRRLPAFIKRQVVRAGARPVLWRGMGWCGRAATGGCGVRRSGGMAAVAV